MERMGLSAASRDGSAGGRLDRRVGELLERAGRLLLAVGRAAAWLNLALLAVILLQVVLRHVFNRGLVPLEELTWHLYAAAFMLGLGYVLLEDRHVRVDILSARFSARGRALVEVLGILFLLLPFAWVIMDHSMDWVAAAWRVNESSENPTGLPWRWLIKSVIPLSFALLLLGALLRLVRQLRILLFNSA